MTRICIVCEGPTESKFVDQVMTPPFAELGLYLEPLQIETSKEHKGGALNYDRVKPFLCNTLRQASAPVVTTFFDLYRLEKRFPGFVASQKTNDLSQKLGILRQALHHDIVQAASCQPQRFIPYIQAHEFEALLFSDVKSLTSIESNWGIAHHKLLLARQSVPTPEHINHGIDTKPKARLEQLLLNPKFANTGNGIRAAKRIGLSKMEAECKNFSAWLTQLRALADNKP
jgi:Domain of unknown function (DUF4276)